MATIRTASGITSTAYPYRQGLDYLRTHANEHQAVAEEIVHQWFGGWREPDRLRLCDYGAGFGDQCNAIVETLTAKGTRSAFSSITSIDTDGRLADFATQRLRTWSGSDVTAHAATDIRAAGGEFDLILAAHVLYYADDRPALVERLVERLGHGGALTVVIRADTCDTFQLRSALRASATRGEPEGKRPRVTESAVVSMLRSAGLAVHHATATTRLTVPEAEVDLRALLGHHRSTDATELLRFLGHYDRNRHGSASAAAFASELERRRRGDAFRFRFDTAVITGAVQI